MVTKVLTQDTLAIIAWVSKKSIPSFYLYHLATNSCLKLGYIYFMFSFKNLFATYCFRSRGMLNNFQLLLPIMEFISSPKSTCKMPVPMIWWPHNSIRITLFIIHNYGFFFFCFVQSPSAKRIYKSELKI